MSDRGGRTGAMYARLVAAEVSDVRQGLQRMHLSDGSSAYALTEVCGTVREGDELLVNVSAVSLGLGTGGAGAVHTNLSRPAEGCELGAGRVMKARYLGCQIPVETWEEAADGGADSVGGGAPELPESPELPNLTGTRVLFCSLLSHAMAVAAALKGAGGIAPGDAPGFVMTDGAALPFVLSDLAAACLEAGVIATAVSTGQAFGAPIEAVTVASGAAALAERGIDRIIVSPGPGHLGTASALGFSALDLAGHAGVLHRLGAQVALCVRASSADARARHRGVSHHSRTIAALGPEELVVPIPAGPDAAVEPWVASLGKRAVPLSPLDVAGALARQGLEITSMGRPLADDRLACAWLGAAAAWLAEDGAP